MAMRNGQAGRISGGRNNMGKGMATEKYVLHNASSNYSCSKGSRISLKCTHLKVEERYEAVKLEEPLSIFIRSTSAIKHLIVHLFRGHFLQNCPVPDSQRMSQPQCSP